MSVSGVSLSIVTDQRVDGTVPLWAERLRRDRLARGQTVRDAVKQLRLHVKATEHLADDEALERAWRRWESGRTRMPEAIYQRAIARMFGSVPAAYFGGPGGAGEGIIRLTEDQTAELIQRLRYSTVDQAAMDALQITVDRLCTDYAAQPAPVVLADAQTWLEKVNGLLDKRVTLAQHREALTMAGWLTLLVACLYYDVGDVRAAEAARLSAFQVAGDVENTEISAWASEVKSWMALTRGDYFATVAAAREGLARTTQHGVAVQLHAQAAKAWARIGNRDEAIVELEAGRELLGRLDFPANPRNHFHVDPTKYDFYAMDCWRLTGADTLAAAAAESVIRNSTAPNGRPISPMRLAEAQLTSATILARGGDFDGAMSLANRALAIDRQSLPSLLLSAREVSDELQRIRPGDPLGRDFANHIAQLSITGP